MVNSKFLNQLTPSQEKRLQNRSVSIYSDFTDVSLPELDNVPGQISGGEGRYLYWLISQGLTGMGAVVEVGTWLGRSTIHLAAGIRDSGISGPKLFSFDRFIWGGEDDNRKSGLNLEPGSDFQPFFEKNIKNFRDNVEVIRADFREMTWSGQPIEVLFLDAPKSASTLSTVLSVFGTALIPEASLITFQDYQHPLSYELPLAIHCLKDKLELLHVIASGGTASFLVKDVLLAEELSLTALLHDFKSLEEIQATWAEILHPLEGNALNRLMCGQAMHLCDLGYVTEGEEVLRGLQFDQRLRDGWKNWARNPSMLERYKPLFNVAYSKLVPEKEEMEINTKVIIGRQPEKPTQEELQLNEPEISVICPMFNEEIGIKDNLNRLLTVLRDIPETWELIIVNDGSTDRSYNIVSTLSAEEEQLKLLSYEHNRGRGFALRSGFKVARGDIIVTTESDLSWGPEIVPQLVKAIKKKQCDIVIASPYQTGGKLENVPIHRAFLSSFGNKILTLATDNNLTMVSGMTRAYRRQVIDALFLESDRKEIHLEIVSKALALGLSVEEIPATLAWEKTDKTKPKRKTNFQATRLIISHLLFSFDERPFLLIGTVSLLLILLGALLIVYLAYQSIFLGINAGSRPLLIIAALLVISGLQLLVFTFNANQNTQLRKLMIRILSELSRQK